MDQAEHIIPLALPSALAAEVEAAAGDQYRPVADMLRDLVELGLAEWLRQIRDASDRAKALALGLPDDERQIMDDAYPSVIRAKIDQGLASAHSGKLVNGEVVFDRIEAELLSLDQEHPV